MKLQGGALALYRRVQSGASLYVDHTRAFAYVKTFRKGEEPVRYRHACRVLAFVEAKNRKELYDHIFVKQGLSLGAKFKQGGPK